MKFLKDDEWFYTTPKGITKKLLLNPVTNQPYKQNEMITSSKERSLAPIDMRDLSACMRRTTGVLKQR